jgi:hypothetical protein
MPKVNIKGVGEVNFPDSMTPAQIEQAIERDILPNRKSPDYWDTFKNAIPKGAAGLADTVMNAPVNAINLGKMGFGAAAYALGRGDLMPDVTAPPTRVADIARNAGVINDKYEPTDGVGRVVDMTGQVFGGGGINPAAIVRAALRGKVLPIARDVAAATASGVGAGVGAEVAGNIATGNESLDNAIHAAGTFVGGALPGHIVAARGTGGDRAAAAIKNVDPARLAEAKALMAKADSAGAPLTGYEAIQARTGMNPKMQTQQRIAEQSDAAGTTLTPIMQGRPQANEAMFNNAANAVSPTNPLPDTIAGQVQKAAQGAIDAARNDGNARAAPYYAQSSNNPAVKIPPHDWNQIAADPGISAALKAVKEDPFSGLQNAQEGSVQWLDAAKKWLDSQSSAKYQAGDRYAGSTRAGAATDITSAIDPVVPAYAKARSIVADNMKNVVEPMEASQVGKLSRSDEFGQQSRAYLPETPLDVTPQVVERTTNTINAQDPNIMRQLLAQMLRSKFNESNQTNVAGDNVFGGAKFAAQVAGNAGQEANLGAALRSTGANGAPLQDALEIFRAQGMKPAVNSATAANMGEAAAGSHTWFDLRRPYKAVTGMADNWVNGLAAKDLAKALADPNSIDRLQEMARINGKYSPAQQQLMVNLLRATPPN